MNPRIHPLSDVQSCHIGEGTSVWQFVVVLPGARIGRNCNICSHVFIENDVVIGDNVTVKCGVQLWDGITLEDEVFVGPNVTFTNDDFPRSRHSRNGISRTLVRRGASIGANATILSGLIIGEGCLIGAGSVVTKNVPDRTIVIGNPGRVIRKLNSLNMEFDLVCGDVSLRLVQLDDAEFVFRLRSDVRLNAHISAIDGNVDSQRKWIIEYKEREAAGKEYYFIIEDSGKAVGTVRLYDFRGDSFCWGSWIIERGTRPAVAIASMLLVYRAGFEDLGFLFSHFEVRKENDSVVRFHLRTGAKVVREDDVNNYFEISRNDFKMNAPRFRRFL